MVQPVSLKGHRHVCPGHRHVGGPVTTAQQNFVMVDGVPIATVGDTCICVGIPTNDAIAEGSAIASIQGKKIARLSDKCNRCSTPTLSFAA